MARGGTQGGLNCLTHVLPRRLPTPTEEADGNGYGVITGRGGPSRPPSRVSVNLVPLLLTGVSLHPPAPKGGPTSTSADVSVPRPRTHDDRTGRVFPDHLITEECFDWAEAHPNPNPNPNPNRANPKKRTRIPENLNPNPTVQSCVYALWVGHLAPSWQLHAWPVIAPRVEPHEATPTWQH